MSRKIILNVPHASLEGVFDRQNGWMNNVPSLQKQVMKWTDWFMDYLFSTDNPSHVDICIGYNEDWSKPSDEFLHKIRVIFRQNGLRAEFNTPYSNSITPESPFKYKSFMLEINKACYMNEKSISFL